MRNMSAWRDAFLVSDSFLEPMSRFPASSLEHDGIDLEDLRVGSISVYLWKQGDKYVSLEPGQNEVWDYIQRHAGYDSLEIVPAEAWGHAMDYGNESLVGKLYTGEIDAAMSLLASCCGRDKLHDFSITLLSRSCSIMFRQPDSARDIFLGQLTVTVWLSILAVLLMLMLAMAMVSQLLGRATNKEGREQEEEEFFNYREILAWGFCMISQQGFDRANVPGLSAKLLVLIGFIFGMVCFYGFSANIVTTLTSANTINSFEELVGYPGIEFYPSFFEPFRQEINESRDDSVKQLWKRIEESAEKQAQFKEEFLKPGQDGGTLCQDNAEPCDNKILEGILDKNEPKAYAFAAPALYIFSPHSFNITLSREVACRATYYRVPLKEQSMSIGISRHSKQRKRIDRATLRLMETGIVRHIDREHIFGVPKCEELQSVAYREVDFKYIYVAYIILGIGYAAAVIIAAFEMFA